MVMLALMYCLIPLIAYGYWWSEGHGASLTRLARIHPGMTGEQVVAILGRPGTINRSEDGFESWYYTRCTWCMVTVHLTSNGLVRRTGHDH